MAQNQLFAKKSLQVLLDEMAGDHRLKRVLGSVTLTALGIGAVIGAGIFVATGAAAKEVAGPALMLSYTMAGITCIFAALCYAEFASMAPVAGSAYTYAYTTMGELFAWIIGWDLVLEYAVGAATVANGWSGYFQSVLLKFGIAVPMVVSGAPHKYDQGAILPNMVAEYDKSQIHLRLYSPEGRDPAVAAKRTLELVKAQWADGTTKPAIGEYWVLLQPDKKAEPPEDKKIVVAGKVGDTEFEKNLKPLYAENKPAVVVNQVSDDKVAIWADGGMEPANGRFWALKDKPAGKTVIVGEFGTAATEAKLQNVQRALINVPAIIIVVIVTIILVKGISESAGFNALMVAIKVAAVFFVIGVGAFFIKPENWTNDFAPFGWTGVSFFGIPVLGQSNSSGDPVGLMAGAAIIFFAYIGFDSVSTHAEEAKNPQRDVPIGIIASLLICTVLYIAVVAVLTGMVPFQNLSKDAGVSEAFKSVGLGWAEFVVAVAGVAGITSVLLVMMLSAPRVFLAMARDGLVPRRIFASVHPRFQTPWISTILIGVFVAAMAGFLPIDALLHLTNIGTLFAFVIVCTAVLIMRKINPDAVRPFRCPFVPVVPILGIGSCLLLMLSLPAANWWRLFAWLALGMVIYFFYGKRHSLLGKQLRGEISTHGISGAGMPADGNRP